MLARSAAAPPSGDGWSYEPKMDGYRCMVDTHGGFRARSRRGWAMAELVPEFEALPPGLMLDGELVSFDADGRPSFDRLGQRMLMRRRDVPVCFVAFDLLAIDGTPTMTQPYSERRAILEALHFGGPCWATVPSFDDGDALWDVVVAQQLEGIVAKRKRDPYVPGDRRLWVKTKSPAWPRRELEREAMARPRERHRTRLAGSVGVR
jgi:bifunctional non-homologous end joining protein LigD